MRALAVSSEKRSPVLPNVPTFKEVGWGDYPGQGWWASRRRAHRRRSSRSSQANSRSCSAIRSSSSFLDKQAVVAAPTSPDGFVEFLKKDRKDAETLIHREHQED